MLTQEEIDRLLDLLKIRKNKGEIKFPQEGSSIIIDLISKDGKEDFIIDVQRKGMKIKKSKCSYQERYTRDTVLLRLDIDGPEHQNPDGKIIQSNHLHICREGYEDKYAIPMPENIFINPKDLIGTLINFLEYCKVENSRNIAVQSEMF